MTIENFSFNPGSRKVKNDIDFIWGRNLLPSIPECHVAEFRIIHKFWINATSVSGLHHGFLDGLDGLPAKTSCEDVSEE